MLPFRIAGWGAYRPAETVPSTALDARFGKPDGWTEAEFGIASRGVASREETSSAMGAEAGRRALAMAGWERGGFDVLVGACGVMEQPIPSTSVLIQDRLGLGGSGIHSFDVNQTCLSFLTALDVVSMGMACGRWRRALVVSSDVATAGLDDAVPKTASIFGDGAGAVAVEVGDGGRGAGVLASRFETYGEGHALATLRAGGTRLRVDDGFEAIVEGSRFRMDAFGIFKAAARRLPPLVDRVLAEAGLSRDTVDLVACHQASAPGVEYVRRLFPGRAGRVVDIFARTGNQVASSLPTVLAHALDAGLAGPGDTVLLLGTSAGISAGAMAVRL